MYNGALTTEMRIHLIDRTVGEAGLVGGLDGDELDQERFDGAQE